MNKSGISAVVATVLIILITVAAVTIIWAAIIPMIKSNLDFSGLEGHVDIVTSEGYTFYDADSKLASVQVKRGMDDGVIGRLSIVFSFAGNSIPTSVVAPDPGNTKVYVFDLSSQGVPDKVSVAPIFVIGKKEKEGEVSSGVDIGEGTLDDSAIIYDLGEDYFVDVPTTGLVAWWKLDNNLNDSIGGHTAVPGSSSTFSFVDGRNAGEFSGNQDDYLYAFPGGDLSPKDNSFSYSMWIYPRSFTSLDAPAYGRFLDQSNYCSAWTTNDSCVWFVGQVYTDGRISFTGRGYADPATFWITAPAGSMVLDQWQHVVYVANRNEHFDYIYLNGELVKNDSMGLSGSLNMVNTFRFVASHAEMNGYLDDVMIYHRALSGEEVKAIYEFQSN